MARPKPAHERPFNDDPDVEVVRKQIPEANLWVAVLDQAIEDILNPCRREAAIHWLLSDSRKIGNFRWVCEHLDLNPHAVRAATSSRMLMPRRAAGNKRGTGSAEDVASEADRELEIRPYARSPH
jgi:hypothetical protein